MKGGLRARMFAASATLALVVGAVFAILLFSISDLRRSANMAQHSEAVLATSYSLEKSLLDIQTGQRGFIITGQERFLQPWTSGLVAFPSEAEALQRLVSDNPQQEARAGTITREGLLYISTWARPLVALAHRSQAQARARVATGGGKRQFDAIRVQFARFATAENLLLAARRSRANFSAHLAVVVGVGGLAGSALLILLFAGYLSRSIVSPIRRASAAAVEIAGGDLSVRVSGSGGGEVAELGRSFNAMASALQENRAALEERNAEIESFAYSVSHDLRAPLRAIDGFSRLLLDNPDESLSPEEARRYLGRIVANVERMGTLIDEMLNLSRVGRQNIDLVRIDLTALARDAATNIETEMEGRHVEIEIGELGEVRGDRGMLEQVFVNLLSNAVKFTRGRDPARIEIGSYVEDGRRVIFVRDNGVGFDMRYADKLFGVFQRLHRQDEFEGVGVGLALCASIVGRHNGRIWAEGKQGEGATFAFTVGEEGL